MSFCFTQKHSLSIQTTEKSCIGGKTENIEEERGETTETVLWKKSTWADTIHGWKEANSLAEESSNTPPKSSPKWPKRCVEVGGPAALVGKEAV